MIRLFTILLISSLAVAHAQETVHLNNGKFQQGKVISQNDENLTFEFTKAGSPTQVNIPWSSISKIEFTPSQQLLDAVKEPQAAKLPTLAKLWDDNADWLSRPESRSAQIGLLYAKKLADSEAEMSEEEALDLYTEISRDAWSEFHQGQAVRGKLRLLLKLGRERDALREAEELALTTENPSHLLEAKHVLAESSFTKLKSIEEENPRWQLDDEVRPERNEEYNKAIDHSLYAFLFYGTEETAATRGLLHAAEVYKFGEDYKNSEICAGDILRLYPESKLADAAKKHLETLSKLKTE